MTEDAYKVAVVLPLPADYVEAAQAAQERFLKLAAEVLRANIDRLTEENQ